MSELMIGMLSKALWLIPNELPGKARIGRMLLKPFMSRTHATLRDRTGCTFVLPSYADPIAQEMFTFGVYERETQKVIFSFLPENGTLIDVGANVGAVSLPIARIRPLSSIVCIEADPNIFEALEENIKRSECGQVKRVSCLVGASDNQVTKFYQAPKDRFGMGSVGEQFGVAPISLKQRSLDALLEELGILEVDVLKIDVEGAELGVLKGAQNLLASKRKPVIVFEFADWAEARVPGQSPGDAQRLLLDAGYRLFDIESAEREELLSPVRQGYKMLLAVPPHLKAGAER